MSGVSPRGHEQGGYRRTNKGSPADWELTNARKPHRCTSSAHYVSGGEYCGGREIQPREVYVRVRTGNWMEFDPMHVDCAIAAGYIDRVADEPCVCGTDFTCLSTEHGSSTKTPDQWCAELGATVIDADGWRDGTRAWGEPITREEFDRRLNRCTLDGRGYPMFLTIPTEATS